MAIALHVAPLPRRSDFGEPTSTDGTSFRALLRHHRLASGLSQEELADRANLSLRAISALEHGERQAPYRATVGALVTALGLAGPERAVLEAAVPRSRGPRGAADPTAGPAPGPVPLSPTPLLDRTQELATARDLLRSDAVRLLTLTGPGGVGKTRLALEVARELQAAFPDGVSFVDLAPLRDPALVLPTLARVLDLHERGHQPLLATVQAYLHDRQLLLVLDNFEQVLAAAPQVAELLAACPSVKLLVTSRTRLRLRWEHTLSLSPLAVPAPELPPTVEALTAVPAVALFVERAQASHPAFALTAENAAAVAALCRHLEGLPLALELAAARTNVLAPAEMLAWAEPRLPVLSWDAPDLPPRQRSLREALAWSSALLPAAEQALFPRLAVFADGWTREAAEAVTGLRELGLDPVESLTRLTDASLVQVSQAAGEGARFRLLETLRELAAEQLAASGERQAIERQHAAYYLALAERAAPALEGPEQGAWFRRLQREQDNLRAALQWAARQGEVEVELRLAGSLADFWWWGGSVREGRDWLEDALARCPPGCEGLRLKALEGAGRLAMYLGESAAAAARLEEALALARALGDGHSTTRVLSALIMMAYLHGQPARWPILAAELEAARPAAEPGDLHVALLGLGLLAHEAGDAAAAAAYLEGALADARQAGDRVLVAGALASLALVAQAQGDRARAAGLVTEALQLTAELGHLGAIAWCVSVAGCVSAERVSAAVLVRLLGAAEALRATASVRLSPNHQARRDQIVAALRAGLGAEAFAAGWAEGRALAPDGLVRAALAALEVGVRTATDATPQASPRPPRAQELLSPREREVLPLVAEGLTNHEIAERLIIAESTVRFHLTALLNKLAADNRTQAVAHAHQQGLL